MYGRLGKNADVREKIADAKGKGAKVEVDEDAGTVVISVGDQVAMRAIQRNPDDWICMYNPAFYPKPIGA